MVPRWLAPLALCALLGACKNDLEQVSGVCTADDTITASCNGTTDAGAPQNLGLLGYSCTGANRPDLSGSYVDGVPQGIVCANQIPPPDGGAPPASPQTYCCTNTVTTCAYDPAAVCDPGTYAYQCQNINRPESYNPDIRCGQGTRGTEYVDYCCSGTGLPSGCGEDDSIACTGGLVGWQCPLQGSNITLPKGQDLLENKSRADQYYLLCSIPAVAPSGKVNNFCCYPPTQVPPGGSCVEDVTVPGCASFRFGFACTGPDLPSDDYPPINCPDPGFAGTSMAGYPATLYCCDFE